MDRNQKQAKKTLMSVTLFLCLYCIGLSQVNTSNNYRLVHSMTYDGKNMGFGNVELFVIDNLAFEGLYTHVERSNSNLQPNGQFVVDKSTVVNKDSLTKYVVTNFKSGKCFVFSLSNPPKLIQTVSVAAKEKITGILFKDEAYEALGNSAKDFKQIADTVIGNFKYQVLENTIGFTIQNIKYRRAKAFLNTSLQQFPFHPLSTQMDKLFGGIVTQIELYGNDGKTFVTNYTIDTISMEKVAFINRYLKLLPR